MKWTDEAPDKEGFYWCFQFGTMRVANIFCLEIDRKKWYVDADDGMHVQDIEAIWMGPIEQPELPK